MEKDRRWKRTGRKVSAFWFHFFHSQHTTWSILACLFFLWTDGRHNQSNINWTGKPSFSKFDMSSRKSGGEILDAEVKQQPALSSQTAGGNTFVLFCSFSLFCGKSALLAGAASSGSPLTGWMHPHCPNPQPDPSYRHQVIIFFTRPILVVTVCTRGGGWGGILTSNYKNGFIWQALQPRTFPLQTSRYLPLHPTHTHKHTIWIHCRQNKVANQAGRVNLQAKNSAQASVTLRKTQTGSEV